MANMDDLLGSLDDQAEQKQQQDEKAAQSVEATQNTDKVVSAVDKNAQSTAEGLKNVKGDVTVTNPDLAKTDDVNKAVEAINKLNLTTFMQNEGLPKLANNISDLSNKTQDLQDKLENEGLKKMSDQLGLVVKKLDEVSKVLAKTEVSVDAKLQKTIDNLSKSINAIDFTPSVNVAVPQPKIVATPVDFKPVLSALASVEQAVKDSETPETEVDLTAVTSGLSAVQKAITALRFPVPNYVLPFSTNTGKATQVVLDANGNVPVSGTVTATVDESTLATSANQTNGTQQSKLTDGTNIANVLKSDGTAAGQNAQLVAGTYLSVPFTTTTAQAVGTTDVGNYASVSVFIATQGGSSTVTFQASDDNTNWTSLNLRTSLGNEVSSTTSTVSLFFQSLPYRYFRLNVTGIVSGTTAGTILFKTLPPALTVGGAIGAAVPGTAVYIGGVTGSGNLAGFNMNSATTNAAAGGFLGASALAQFDDVSPQTITENNFGNLRISTNRNLYSTLRDAAGNERGANVDAANNLNVVNYANTSTLTNVASSGTNVTLLSSNAAAKSRIVYNESTQVLYLKFGVTASVTSYTVQVPANSLFEFPLPNYTGQVDGLWASANGNARVTEVT